MVRLANQKAALEDQVKFMHGDLVETAVTIKSWDATIDKMSKTVEDFIL